jgi:hypothetical protein
MLFPFLGLPEFWEYVFVLVPAFIIAYCGIWLLKNIDSLTEGSDADSLQDYIENLKKRFKDEKRKHQGVKKKPYEVEAVDNNIE